MDPKKALSITPGTTLTPTSPIQAVAEAVAAARKTADDELAHRLAMDVLGEPGDPLKAVVEKAIPGRVDVHGNLTKDSRSI